MIDTHVHLWRLGRNGCAWPSPDLESIYRDFTLDDLRDVARPAGIDQAILVQSQEDEADTAWLLSIADDPLIAGVVGWIDPLQAEAPVAIDRLASDDWLRGLRPMVQDREAGWYDLPELDPAFAAMAEKGLVLDALVRPKHLPSLQRLAGRHPALTVVIDHGAKPDFRDLVSWGDQMAKIARLPNVSCKLSGLLTELPRGAAPDAVDPAFDLLWRAFGGDRLIWASDWPVLTLVAGYDVWLDQAQKLVPADRRDAVFDSNARRIYGIQQ